MTPKLQELMLASEYASPEHAVRAQKLAELVAQRCIQLVALVGLSNWENSDITWACQHIITTIREEFHE